MMSNEKARILIVDDDPSILRTLSDRMVAKGHDVVAAENGEAALDATRARQPDLMILDLHLPILGGMDVLRTLREEGIEVGVLVVTAYGELGTAVEAMKLGALDFITKPFDLKHMDVAVAKAVEQVGLVRENRLLHAELRRHSRPVVAESSSMKELLKMVEKLSGSRTTVLLLGESGTGKEVIARLLHQRSGLARRPFVAANCAALPADLMESELFGHEQGAFTGATKSRKGLFEVADGGTLFLDEIGEMPIGLQPKLLRVLQDHSFTRVGGTRELKVDVRVVAATNKNLEDAVREGEFRKDLYYRLNVISLEVTPLRQRPEDTEVLARTFLERYRKETHSRIRKISNEAMALLKSYPWPGNVRELENAIERAVVLADGTTLLPEDLPDTVRHGEAVDVSTSVDDMVDLGFHGAVKEFKRRLLRAALERFDGVQVNAAKALDLHPTYLSRLLKNLGSGSR